MTKLDRYIGKSVLGAMLMVLLLLGGLDWLFGVIDELGETEGGYGSLQALQFVLFKTPRHLYEMLPYTTLIGALAGLGTLAGSNELVSMQAAGWSKWRITRAVLQPTLLVMLLGIVLGEFVAPRLELQAEVNKALAQGETVGVSRYGHWQRDQNRFIHFNAVDANNHLLGVTVLSFDADQRLQQQWRAERAEFIATEDANALPSWRLLNGQLLEFNYQTQQVLNTQTTFTEQRLTLDIDPALLQVLVIDADRMSISNLWRFAQRFSQQGLDAKPYQLGFWKKALQPLNTLVLVLIAVSFIFGPLRSASMGSRVFSAICLGLSVFIVQRLLENVSSVYGFSALAAVLVPIVACLLAGIVLISRRA